MAMRAWVAGIVVVTLGCSDPSFTVDTAPEGNATEESTVEIFSWWTAGGELDGLQALFEHFQRTNPHVRIENAVVEGGAGVNAQSELEWRMSNADPPDSFQVHAGEELNAGWVATDAVEPVTWLFEEQGWSQVLPPGLLEILSHDGELWAVPLNIHRANVLWYNRAAFAAASLDAPETWQAVLDAAPALQANGVVPIALGNEDGWTLTQWFETLLLAELGVEGYRGLWTGSTDWRGTGVTRALETLRALLPLVDPEHASLTWDEAAARVADGRAAMTIMGDWAAGYFSSQRLEIGLDIGWVPTPGTRGVFQMLSDTFSLPRGAQHRDNAVRWLIACGSAEGQDAFNPLKGSIPARLDADHSLYGEYAQAALRDFAQDEIVPSLTHGAAAAAPWVANIEAVLSAFELELDVAAAREALAGACAQAGHCS
jgi:glucose/mannose transport system substrate-binding protein